MSQLMAVENLKERILCAQSEDQLRVFNLDEFVPALLDLLDFDYNGEVLLATVICLNYLMSNLPQSISFIVKHGGIKKFCVKLQSIEYAEVAEAAITSLHKLSIEHPEQVLEAGGIVCCTKKKLLIFRLISKSIIFIVCSSFFDGLLPL